MYRLIVSVLIILFLLFYIQLFSYFCCKHVNKRSVFSSVFSHDFGGKFVASASGRRKTWLMRHCRIEVDLQLLVNRRRSAEADVYSSYGWSSLSYTSGAQRRSKPTARNMSAVSLRCHLATSGEHCFSTAASIQSRYWPLAL